MRYVILLLTLLLITPVIGGSASPSTYYVSPNGDDSNPGTMEKPWKSLSVAVSRLKPGDTLILLPGEYLLRDYEKDVIRPPSGREDAWITIKGQGAALVGTNNLLTAFDLSGVRYVRIEGLEITSRGAFRDGIEALNEPAEHIVLKDLYIHHLDEFGINMADVNHLVIDNCTITYCGFGSIGGPAGQSGGWRNVLVNNSYLAYAGHHYSGGENPYDRPDGFGIEPSEGPIEIAYTVVEHNRGDGIDSKAKNTYIHNCVVANNFADGVKLWGDGSRVENTLIYGRGDGREEITPWSPLVISSESAGGFEIIGVTVDDYLGGNYLMHVQYDYDVKVKLTVKNTIFSSRGPNAPIFIRKGVEYSFEGCLFYFPRSEFVITDGESSIGRDEVRYGDPMFVKPAWGDRGDYHLREGSPAIDSGVEVDLKVDLDGGDRPVGEGYDIGAYEYGSKPAKPVNTGSISKERPEKASEEPSEEIDRERSEPDGAPIYLIALALLVALLALKFSFSSRSRTSLSDTG